MLDPNSGSNGNPFIFSQPSTQPSGSLPLIGQGLNFAQKLGQQGTFSALGLKPARFMSPAQHLANRQAGADRLAAAAAAGDTAALDQLYSLSGHKDAQHGFATQSAKDYAWQKYNQVMSFLGTGQKANGNPATVGSDPMNVAPGNNFSGFGFPKDFGKTAEDATGIPLSMWLILGAGLLLLKKGLG